MACWTLRVSVHTCIHTHIARTVYVESIETKNFPIEWLILIVATCTEWPLAQIIVQQNPIDTHKSYEHSISSVRP